MRSSPSSDPSKSTGRSQNSQGQSSLTRKEFYDLSAQCREYALEYARHDQTRVSLKHCNEFNAWLPQVKRYSQLAPALTDLVPARPIARWQVMVLAALVGLVVMFAFAERLDRIFGSLFIYIYMFGLLLLYFVPERLYGTTMELLEAKLLRIVEAMEQVLHNDNQMEFTEAVYFQVKENLEAARTELRQQIDLVHRRWR